MSGTEVAARNVQSGALQDAVLHEHLLRIRTMLSSCSLCEHRCACDRAGDPVGRCRLGLETRVLRQELTLLDDPEWVPALRVYLAGCSFRCKFCNTAPECFSAQAGQLVTPDQLARAFVKAMDHGARSIILLGGEPTLHAHTLLELAASAGRTLPLVLNTNGYMSPDVIELLGHVVRGWVVDFKFGNDTCAQTVAGIPRYTAILTRNLQHLASTQRLHVRHLLLPGHLECCFKPVVQWLSTSLPGVRFCLMTGYVPHFRAQTDPTLGRLNRRDDLREVQRLLSASTLNWSID